ncbi:hypothetical protein [Glycomyces buryatensis]|uniref:Uncharacterized protein n=1 Tax=Glycomyces buryatensis TaxID=2570927 RepID=A0A4V4HSQ0_9ACTN|nr:hypothetical protein [Glycomyces buryatensis]THV42536.1 hypothetical protein FAB82_05010 [Glycomyces buryatensis]
MFDNLPVLRHLAQNQLLNRKRRNERHGERIQIAPHHADRGTAPGPGALSDTRPTPNTGNLVLLWTVSNLTNKPGM